MEGWLARLELGDDGMMERYLTLFEEDLKFVFPGRREEKRTGFNGGRKILFWRFRGMYGNWLKWC